MNKLSKEVLTRLDLHDPLSAKYVRALQAQLNSYEALLKQFASQKHTWEISVINNADFEGAYDEFIMQSRRATRK